MAAKLKEGGHGKRKRVLSPSTPPNIDISYGKRTTKSSTLASPHSDNLLQTEKPIPHYRNPTISFSNVVCKYGSRTASRHLTLTKALPRSPREKPLKPKFTSPRTPKTLKNGKNRPLVVERKDPRKEATRRSTISPDKQEEEEPEPDVVMEIVKKEVVEHAPLHILPTLDKSFCDSLDSETKIFENKLLEASDSTPLLEEHEEHHETEQIRDIKGYNDEGENHYNDEEQASSMNSTAKKPQDDVENEKGETGPKDKLITKGKKAVMTDSGGMKKPHKVMFIQGKVIDKKEVNGVGLVRLKFKEGGYERCLVEVLRRESVNVVLKRREIEWKKEAAAYNHMIEETSSKLVENRKSKVKALVGYFETVISLGGQSQSHRVDDL